jgi:predicted transcriptional regulator
VDSIWEQTARYEGITRDFYLSYFANKEKAYAIKIRDTKRYAKARRLSDYNRHVAPQSFAYIRKK